MKTRGIMFKAPMVRGLLDDRKGQTRRLIKYADVEGFHVRDDGVTVAEVVEPNELCVFDHSCPYGQPGDRLWVREAWRPRLSDPTDLRSTLVDGKYRFDFAAGGEHVVEYDRGPYMWIAPKATLRGFVSPMFLPKWAARITREITRVRVERAQAISEADAVAEGVELVTDGRNDGWLNYLDDGAGELFRTPTGDVRGFRTARQSFASLWISINGVDSWNENPWVWVIDMKKVEA